MAFATGMLGAASPVSRVSEGAGMTNLFSLVAGVTAFLRLLMIAACGRHCFREYVGLRKSLNTFAVSFRYCGCLLHHPRYPVLPPRPGFGRPEVSSKQPPALLPSVVPEASLGPPKAGIPQEGCNLKQQEIAKT
jgi:hypothetical protein